MKRAKFMKILCFSLPKNWLHLKSEWQKNHEIFTLCNTVVLLTVDIIEVVLGCEDIDLPTCGSGSHFRDNCINSSSFTITGLWERYALTFLTIWASSCILLGFKFSRPFLPCKAEVEPLVFIVAVFIFFMVLRSVPPALDSIRLKMSKLAEHMFIRPLISLANIRSFSKLIRSSTFVLLPIWMKVRSLLTIG